MPDPILSPASFECPAQEVLDMVVLRRFFKLFFDNVYSTSDNYGKYREELKCLVAPDRFNVELDLIVDPGKPTHYNRTVSIGFGDMQFGNPVVNSEAAPSDDLATGNYVVVAKVPIVIHHVMTTADASYQLAEITFQALFGLRPWIMRRLGLRGFNLSQMSRAKVLTGSPEPFYTVDVGGMLEFNYNMQTTIQGHILKKVFFEPLT